MLTFAISALCFSASLLCLAVALKVIVELRKRK
jgi:hypothetical protein